MTLRIADRTRQTATFHAMEVFKRTLALQAQGRDVISLGIGEPDFTAAPQVVEAMQRAADRGLGKYGPAAGMAPLREAIAQFYADTFHASVSPRRVIVTSGASGALLLACLALINPGEDVLMPDPSYPPNHNFIMTAGGRVRLVPTTAAGQFQMTADDVDRHWSERTAGVLIASPSNPTGTSIERPTLAELIRRVKQRNGFVIVDEIYLGLSYRDARESALALDDDVIVLNSFSKYFHMTGWRLGWMVVPEQLVEPIEKMASSLAICAPTLAQHGALACFEPDALALFEHRREAFRTRRDYLVGALESIGLGVPAKPDGAFYVYADVTRYANDSNQLVDRLLDGAGVALVPGIDFGPTHAASMVRLAYTVGLDRLKQAVQQMADYLQGG